MTNDDTFRLSRRKVLAGLGTIGIASAGAGVGTTAYFSDEETFENNVLTAGSLDLFVDYYSYVDQGSRGMIARSGTADGEPAVRAELDDVKPGDDGLLGFCFRVEDNPAYLWMCGELTANDDNGATEAEQNHSADTTFGEGEGDLADAIDVVVSYCDVPEEVAGADDFAPTAELWRGSFADFLAEIETGIPLDGMGTAGVATPGEQACFAGTRDVEADNPCLCIDWEVPTEVGNEIQTDSLAFDLQFYAEQCRHNDGTNNPCVDVTTTTGEGWPFTEGKWSPQAIAGSVGNDELRFESPDGVVSTDLGTSLPYANPSEWFYNTAYPFTLTYDGAGSGTFSVEHGEGTASLTQTVPGAAGRVGLVAKSHANFDFEIEGVTIDDGSYTGPSGVQASGDGAKSHLQMDGATLSDGFTLTGQFTFRDDARSSSDRVEQVGNYGMNVLVEY